MQYLRCKWVTLLYFSFFSPWGRITPLGMIDLCAWIMQRIYIWSCHNNSSRQGALILAPSSCPAKLLRQVASRQSKLPTNAVQVFFISLFFVVFFFVFIMTLKLCESLCFVLPAKNFATASALKIFARNCGFFEWQEDGGGAGGAS